MCRKKVRKGSAGGKVTTREFKLDATEIESGFVSTEKLDFNKQKRKKKKTIGGKTVSHYYQP